jgi:hypothetical protein
MRVNNASLIIFIEAISHNLFFTVAYIHLTNNVCNFLNETEKKMIKLESNDKKNFELIVDEK